MKNSANRDANANPDQLQLTPMQAERLGALNDVPAKALIGLTVSEIRDKFSFQIDPAFLRYRKVCGKVVKKDPVTGVEYPVPYATVHVEDTDCSLLGFFPAGARWAWYFPYRCRREVIATAKTDECGRYCVWIPRWEIDWVLRFRHERHCFPIIFERPSIRDLLDPRIPHNVPHPFPDPDPFGPRPGPDPAPFGGLDRGHAIRNIEALAGREVAMNLDQLHAQTAFGRSNVELGSALNASAFSHELAPPLPMEWRVHRGGESEQRVKGAATGASMDTVRASLASRLRLDTADLKALDLRAFIGPFKRCHDVFVPEWVPIIDVPDITFRVTQDTNGDGVDETIYSEGYFQVRWNDHTPGPAKIHVSPNARAGLSCDGPRVPCGNAPAIVLAGRMPVVNVPTIYDPLNGYALRPNRPHPSGLFADALPNPLPELWPPYAASPFLGAVSLLGCNRTDSAATHYRLMFKYSANGGASFTSYAPFLNLTWPLFRLDGAGNSEWHYPTPDAQGWYPITLPAGPNPFLPQDLLLDWPTYAFANGRYVLQLELGTGGTATSSSDEVAFNIDNSAPLGPLSIEWRQIGRAFQLLTQPCPIVKRPLLKTDNTPVDLEFRVTLDASAAHLRSASLSAGGCGGGNFIFVSGTPEHWHTSPSDNAEILQAVYRLPATAHEGTYSFSAHVASRAFNPNGGDDGHLLPEPWEYDPEPSHIDPHFAFSVINANA